MRVMELASVVVVVFSSILGWFLMQWRRQVLLDKQVARQVALSDARAKERLGYEVTRAVTIGDIIRELPAVDEKRDTRAH
jgi:hypothetical protein